MQQLAGPEQRSSGRKKHHYEACNPLAPRQGSASLDDRQFSMLSSFIEGELGIKMPPAKRVMLESRLQKRLRALSCASFEQYLEIVFSESGGNTELIHMIDAVTTNKTDFFREPDHFEYLLGTVLPDRWADAGWGRHEPFRLWSTASSSGEEPYTLAMIAEEFRARAENFQYRVLATDISSTMLDRGRSAIYPEDRIEPVPPSFRSRYFLRSKERENRLVRVKPALRSRVRFERLNLMSDDFGIRDRFEVIFCRNVIIYFDRQNQSRLLHKLFSYLVPGGYLFLGHSETLAGMDLPLYTVAPTIYRKPE
ncbi:CheR family methyltransferase [Salinispira pacifica]